MGKEIAFPLAHISTHITATEDGATKSISFLFLFFFDLPFWTVEFLFLPYTGDRGKGIPSADGEGSKSIKVKAVKAGKQVRLYKTRVFLGRESREP